MCRHLARFVTLDISPSPRKSKVHYLDAPVESTMMLAGLTSRCTTLFSCPKASASSSSRICATPCDGQLARRDRRDVRPCTSSMTM